MSVLISVSVFIPRLSIFIPRLSIAVFGSAITIFGSSNTVPWLSAVVFRSSTPASISILVLRLFIFVLLSALTFTFVLVPELYASVSPSMFAPIPGLFSLFASSYAFIFRSSPLLFPPLSLPKILTSNLAIGRIKPDDTIGR